MAEGPEVPTLVAEDGAGMPAYARAGDAGADLCAAADVVLPAAGGRARVGTGVRVAIPQGYAGFLLPRSGLASNHGVTCLNAPGLVDSGYRGELQVVLVNTDPEEPYQVRRGDRICQLVIQRVELASFVEAAELPPSARDGGFGHTGR